MAAGITAAQIYQLNHMNSTANKVQLGTLIQNAEALAGNVNLANGKILMGDGSGVGQAVTPSGDVTMTNTGVNAIGAAKVLKAMLDPTILVEATGTLTQANLQAMNGAAVNLIAAPGAGKLLVPIEMEFFHSYSTAVYTGGGVVSVQYTGSTAIVKTNKTLVTDAASKTFWTRPSLFDLDNATGTAEGGLEVDAQVNLGIEITNGTAAFTLGNAANVLKWRILYRVITLLT